ncbi:MAG: Hsp20/alpha crystallin family protein, partial [Candidatus Eisenbacteria bacterium]
MPEEETPKRDEGVREMLDFLATHSPCRVRREAVLEPVYWSPPADVYEVDGVLFVVLEIAGMKSKEFQIRVEEGMLVIRGERKAPHHRKPKKYHSLEWASGLFERRIPLPAGFDLGRPSSR